jgi:hypothetical protein
MRRSQTRIVSLTNIYNSTLEQAGQRVTALQNAITEARGLLLQVQINANDAFNKQQQRFLEDLQGLQIELLTLQGQKLQLTQKFNQEMMGLSGDGTEQICASLGALPDQQRQRLGGKVCDNELARRKAKMEAADREYTAALNASGGAKASSDDLAKVFSALGELSGAASEAKANGCTDPGIDKDLLLDSPGRSRRGSRGGSR